MRYNTALDRNRRDRDISKSSMRLTVACYDGASNPVYVVDVGLEELKQLRKEWKRVEVTNLGVYAPGGPRADSPEAQEIRKILEAKV